MLATDGTWREADDAVDDWRRAVVAPALVASLVLALAVAAFLFLRRVSGALDTPLAPAPLVLTASAVLAWSAAIRLRLRDRRIDALAAVVLALFAIACSFPGSRAIDWVVWLAAFAAYGLVPARRSSPAVESASTANQVVQQLTRSRAADGCEAIHGSLVAEFAAGERTVVLHVAFCPPFERLPTIEAEAVDGPACDVKAAQILHQGARLEARLSRASTAAELVTIEFAATDGPQLAD
jgi:hypothetical protein